MYHVIRRSLRRQKLCLRSLPFYRYLRCGDAEISQGDVAVPRTLAIGTKEDHATHIYAVEEDKSQFLETVRRAGTSTHGPELATYVTQPPALAFPSPFRTPASPHLLVEARKAG